MQTTIKVIRTTFNVMLLMTVTIIESYILANIMLNLPNTTFYHSVIGMLLWGICPIVVVCFHTMTVAVMLFQDNNN